MCMIDDAAGFCVVLHSAHRKANKTHKCHECCKEIVLGEIYLNEGILFEQEKHTHKTCKVCEKDRELLTADCGGFVYGQVRDDIKSHEAK